MSASQIVIKEAAPSALEFANLRVVIGWENPELGILQKSINSSLYWVSAFYGETLVGCGRVVGDGAMYFYVQDIMVHPSHQNVGLGSEIMQSINQYLSANCPSGSTIGLFAAQGKEAFYEKFGFISRTGQNLGLGMCKFV